MLVCACVCLCVRVCACVYAREFLFVWNSAKQTRINSHAGPPPFAPIGTTQTPTESHLFECSLDQCDQVVKHAKSVEVTLPALDELGQQELELQARYSCQDGALLS